MDVSAIATFALLTLSQVLGIQSTPESNAHWTIEQNWQIDNAGYLNFKATSTTLLEQCHSDKYWLNLPVVIHGVHSVYLDGTLLKQFGDNTFQAASNFYNAPFISCSELKGRLITWEVSTYSHYFARFNDFPKVIKSRSVAKRLTESLLQAIPLSLALLGVFVFILLGKVLGNWSKSFLGACIGWAVFVGIANGLGQALSMSMLTAHKLADLALWIGTACLLYCFHAEGWLRQTYFKCFAYSLIPSFLLILIGTSGDAVQLGTSIPFPFLIVAVLAALFQLVSTKTNQKERRHKDFGVLAIAVFVFAVMHDIFLTLGLFDGALISPYGIIVALTALALSASAKINGLYNSFIQQID